MRQQQYLLIAHQARVHAWLMFVHVQADGENFPGVECGDQGGFVNDGAPASIDDDDAGFHLVELML